MGCECHEEGRRGSEKAYVWVRTPGRRAIIASVVKNSRIVI
jgi:hypothetical protein